MASTVDEFALLLASAGFAGYLLRSRGYSATAGYVMVGILFGSVFHLINPQSSILQFLSSLAITVVSFEIGLMLKTSFLKAELPKILPIIGIEIGIVLPVMSGVAKALGLGIGDLLTIVFASLNTSTAVTFKLLEEKGLLETSHFKNLLLGLASMEDVVALVELSLFPVIVSGGSPFLLVNRLNSVFLSLLFAIAFGSVVVKRALKRAVKGGQDLVVIASLGTVAVVQSISPLLSVSSALMALVIGLSVSQVEGAESIDRTVTPLRDFFFVVFFVLAGAELPALPTGSGLVVVIVLVGVMVIMKAVAFVIGAYLTGTGGEEAVKLGIYMTPISEFGIVIASYGLANGITTGDVYLSTILVVVVSSLVASYMSKFDTKLSHKVAEIVPQDLISPVNRFRAKLLGERMNNSSRRRGSGKNTGIAIWEATKVGLTEFATILFASYFLLLIVYFPSTFGLTSLSKVAGPPAVLVDLLLPVYLLVRSPTVLRKVVTRISPYVGGPLARTLAITSFLIVVLLSFGVVAGTGLTISSLSGDSGQIGQNLAEVLLGGAILVGIIVRIASIAERELSL